MKLKLPNSVSSPQDLKALELEVRDYARWFSHHAIKKQVNVKDGSDQPSLSPAAKELLGAWAAKKPMSQQSLGELSAVLKDFGDAAPTMTITLAAPPPGSLKAVLVAWCRENIAPDVLVTFQFNATLLGGMVVRSGSRIFDWSFRRQILAAREHFPEVLRRV